MDDYPNSSDAWSVEPPEERIEAETKELEQMASSVPVIQDVLDWLNESADFYSSIDSLDIKESTDPNAALVTLATAKRMRAAFQSKSAEFQTKFKSYLKQKEQEAGE